MKNFLLLFTLILFYNCTPKFNATKGEDLTFVNGKEKVKLEILTGNKYIESEVATTLKVTTENINVEDLAFAGPGVRFIKSENKIENEINLEINSNKDNFPSGNYTLMVFYKSNRKSISHRFLIPIK